MNKQPIVNCHTHIFTGDQVPPFLAKTFLPWPLYYLLPVNILVGIFRLWFKGPGSWPMKPWYKKAAMLLYTIKVFLSRTYVISLVSKLVGAFLTIQTFFILYDCIGKISKPNSSISENIEKVRDWLTSHLIPAPVQGIFFQVLIVFFVLLFVPSGRNLLIFIFKQIWKFLGKLPGKSTKELMKRYLNLGRFAFHERQATIFGILNNQYPEKTKFVALPMDMEYMGAGSLKQKHRYRNQMDQLAEIKARNPNEFYPFVFVDPRRIGVGDKEINYLPGDKDYFNYTVVNNKVVLGDCFIKDYIEDKKFSGFKIYPALGYFPFDDKLLALWKYAADNQIPILSHCIRGTIYYRGKKEKAWDNHPFFEEAEGDQIYGPLLLPERKNINFSVNFTHPLNYLCLLNEELLRKVVGRAIAKDNRLKDVFGYTDENTKLTSDLHDLKLCIAHFGGEDEWQRYFEKDRYGHSNQLTQYPDFGIDFLYTKGKPMKGKMEQLWKYTDWYSIICSMMLQYPRVYADISYILHDCDSVLPLLKETLQNPGLQKKVLYGTDFYVVRNHKSDKNILADMYGGLSETEFDLIARQNPIDFLRL
jgi:predicted TIM-barrel fold metal-dependent hydrolase